MVRMAVQTSVDALHVYRCPRGKHSIEMRDNKHDILAGRSFTLANHVANGIRTDFQAIRRQNSRHVGAAFPFFKLRRGNFRDGDLLVRDPGCVFIEPGECFRDSFVLRDGVNWIGGPSGQRAH